MKGRRWKEGRKEEERMELGKRNEKEGGKGKEDGRRNEERNIKSVGKM